MGEPTASVGMYFTAINNYNRAKKSNNVTEIREAKRKLGRTLATLPIAGALTAMSKAIIQAMRDDDEDESYLEKWLGHYMGNFKEDLNPLNSLPVFRDIMSIIDGWDVERPDMTLIADLVTAIQRAFDEDSEAEDVLNAVTAFANMFGIPAKNVIRDVRGFINTIKSFIHGEKTTSMGIEIAIEEALTGEEISNAEQLYEAMLRGDKAQINRVKGRFKDADKLKTAIRSTFKKHYLAGDLNYNTTLRYLTEYGEMDEDEAFWKMREWEYENDHGDTEDYSKYNDFFTAVESGKNLKAVIKMYTDNGVDVKTLASQITSHFKPLYKEMSNYDRAKIKGYLLNAYELLDSDKYNRTKKSKDIDKWVEEED
jgi:hypothetical protein